VSGTDGAVRIVVTTHGGRRITERRVVAWAAEAARLGAGEILLTSVDADGTREGFDIEMLRSVRGAVDVPIVASGGAGKLAHFVTAVREGGADAVLAAGVFHERVFTIEEVKLALASAGVPVRLAGVPPAARPPLGVHFDETGLVPVVVRDVRSGEILTLAWANAEALDTTRTTRLSHFYSRSRKKLWKKGETSGHVQHVTTISVDCDGDAVVYDVVPEGPACHTGSRSCFRVAATLDGGAAPATLDLGPLFAVVLDRMKNPVPGSYTNRLLDAGIPKIAKKVGEEGVEAALAALVEDDDALAGEAADLLYHLIVLLAARGLTPGDVEKKLRDRRGVRRPA
jgi:phosphoribosyl-ATP pyrophosphohydrolase